MVDSGNSKNKPLTMDIPGNGYKSFSNNEMDFSVGDQQSGEEPVCDSRSEENADRPQLNSAYTFDTFIEGDCNRVARRAGIHGG